MLTKSLTLATPAAQTVGTANGASKLLSPDSNEDNIPVGPIFKAIFEAVQTSTGTSDMKVQTSWNGTNWLDVATMTQIAGAGQQNEAKTISTLGPYVRAVCTVTGAGNLSGTVRLVSNSEFVVIS